MNLRRAPNNRTLAFCDHNGCHYINPGQGHPDLAIAKSMVCGSSPENRIAKSAAFTGTLAAIRVGAFFGAAGGAEAGGIGAIPGAIIGGIIGGVVGASGGVLTGSALAGACSEFGAY